MTTPSLIAKTARMERGPNLASLDRRKMKVLRKHADDRVRHFIQGYWLADDLFFTAKTLLPCGIAEDHRARCLRQIFAGVKIAAKHRSNTESTKEAVTHTAALDHFLPVGRAED